MPRKKREKSKSGIYHVMVRGINQQQIFEDEEDYIKYLSLLKECKQLSGCKMFAYCLMGNHIHLLIKEEGEPLDITMKRIGSRFVYWYNVKYQRSGHLFQDRFKSEPVEDDVYLKTVIRYIHQNPVKAGLCKKPSDYQFSSYNEYFIQSDLVDKEFVFDILPIDLFEEFNNKNAVDICLDVNAEYVPRVTDEQAQQLVYKHSGCNSASEFQNLEAKKRDKCLKKLRGDGLSIRQISRLTGVSCGIIRKFN